MAAFGSMKRQHTVAAVVVPKRKALTVLLLLLLATTAMLQQQQDPTMVVVLVSGFQPSPRLAASSSSSSSFLLLPFFRGSSGVFWTNRRNKYADCPASGCGSISGGLVVASIPSSSSSTTCASLSPTSILHDDLFPTSSQQMRSNENNFDTSNSLVSSPRINSNGGGGGAGAGAGSVVGQVAKTLSVTMALCSVLLFMSLTPSSCLAYTDTDYANETVQTTIKALKDAAGDPAATFKAYETLADIITEGSGLGGSVNFQGVTLDRGYIADEDTAIYNPGLTLLTESEKERLVQAVIASRSASQQASSWTSENQLAFEFLREKLDPYHMQELSGYLGFLPYYAAVVYLAVLGVQQLARDFFPVAYFVGVAAVFLPAIALVLLGPS